MIQEGLTAVEHGKLGGTFGLLLLRDIMRTRWLLSTEVHRVCQQLVEHLIPSDLDTKHRIKTMQWRYNLHVSAECHFRYLHSPSRRLILAVC